MAATRHALPSGGWVELRDVAELRAKDRKAMLNAMAAGLQVDANTGAASMSGAAAVTAGFDAGESVATTLITAWELPYLPGAAIPSLSPGALDELTIGDYDTVIEAIEPARRALFPRTVDPSDQDDPVSPSGPVSG